MSHCLVKRDAAMDCANPAVMWNNDGGVRRNWYMGECVCACACVQGRERVYVWEWRDCFESHIVSLAPKTSPYTKIPTSVSLPPPPPTHTHTHNPTHVQKISHTTSLSLSLARSLSAYLTCIYTRTHTHTSLRSTYFKASVVVCVRA